MPEDREAEVEVLRRQVDALQRERAVLRHQLAATARQPQSVAPADYFQRDSRPPVWGPPPRRLSAYDLDMDARRRELDKGIAESLMDPGADWGG